MSQWLSRLGDGDMGRPEPPICEPPDWVCLWYVLHHSWIQSFDSMSLLRLGLFYSADFFSEEFI